MTRGASVQLGALSRTGSQKFVFARRQNQQARRACSRNRIAADTPKGFASGHPPLQELLFGWQPLQRTRSDGLGFKRSRRGDCPLFYSVEGRLENFEVAGVASFFAGSLDPFFLQRILRWAVRFVEDPEDAGKGKCGEFVRGDFIGDVMPQFVLGRAVPFLFW